MPLRRIEVGLSSPALETLDEATRAERRLHSREKRRGAV
jgi:hypothetical protein